MASDEQTEAHWRSEIEQRPARPADMISEAVGIAVAEALVHGQFQEFLRSHDWALVHVGDGSCPEAPAEWLHDGLALFGEGWVDPLGRLEELWRQAWTEGNRAGRATA